MVERMRRSRPTRSRVALFFTVALSLGYVLPALVPPAWLAAQDVLINEIHYDPPLRTRFEEFIELHNPTGVDLDLSGCFFSSGIEFVFPDGATLSAGGHVVVAQDPDGFQDRFGFAPDFGPWVGRLANNGERVTLRRADGARLDEVDYQVGFPWPLASGGQGSSMELIHPSLSNDLGGSWRAAGLTTVEPTPPRHLVAAQSSGWRYRRGSSEASNPRGAWREVDFEEDGSWRSGRTPIGYGDGDDNTVLDDMRNSYSTVYLRHGFDVDDPGDVPGSLELRLYVDDGAVAWINGTEVARVFAPGGDLAHDAHGTNHEAAWVVVDLPNPRNLLEPGENILAIHALNQADGSSDFSIDAVIVIPGTDGEFFGDPTPGQENSVHSVNAPPQVRQVRHLPRQPSSGAPFAVACKVTDPNAVASVTLLYQVVEPGDYIPAFVPLPHATLISDPDRSLERNPEFDDPASWVEVPMLDDGGVVDALAADDIYSAGIPAQDHRTLVRYRIRAVDTTGETVSVPYPDDPSLNFAAFVHDGVPPYRATASTVQPGGAPYTYAVEDLTRLPVYMLLTRNSDLAHCIAYDSSLRIPKSNEGARDRFNWEGCFVYDGFVYDHIRYRLRQANDRYGTGGKRSMRFRFRKGNHLRARDRHGRRYPTRWRTLNSGKMFDNKRVGNFGLTEQLNNMLWNMVGVPSPFVHTFHFRVIDNRNESSQYSGDFWGMFLAFEDYDTRFLEAHELEDGTLYKLKDGRFNGDEIKRHQGRFAVSGDADFQNIRSNLRPQRTDAWLDAHVNYDRWYYYHTIVEAIRHYDFRPADSHSKNRSWYFEPSYDGSRYGRLWTLPHDHDASWGPNWNSGVDYSKNAIHANGGKPAFKQRYRNAMREVRDLLWTEEVIHEMIDDLANERREIAKADRDRWRGAPASEGRQDYGSMPSKVADMKRFAFVGWSGSTGPRVGAGGRAAYMDSLSDAEGDSASMPRTPTVAYIGAEGFPADGLACRSSSFSDPQGSGTFRAMKWRVGEITDPVAPGHDPDAPLTYEWDTVWESEDLRTFSRDVVIPPVLSIGHSYRVRVKMQDTSSRWSHWSPPLEITVGEPTRPFDHQSYLRVTELMYNPTGGGDFEYLELQNTGPTALDLEGVRFTDGIEFGFEGSGVEDLGPGEFVLLVNNRVGFESRYDTVGMRIAGEYGGRLSNTGESIALTLGGNLLIQEFSFDDEWYVLTDGVGHSLEIIDPGGLSPMWDLPEGWQPSGELLGTPGRPSSGSPPTGGFRFPSDANGDSVVDVSDTISLVLKLFVGGSPLPCDGDAVNEGGNAVLLDANGDDNVDISDPLYLLNYLFAEGPGPTRGFQCTRIEGCSTICSQ